MVTKDRPLFEYAGEDADDCMTVDVKKIDGSLCFNSLDPVNLPFEKVVELRDRLNTHIEQQTKVEMAKKAIDFLFKKFGKEETFYILETLQGFKSDCRFAVSFIDELRR